MLFKCNELNCIGGAALSAFSAAGAFGCINLSAEVFNLNGFKLAGLNALHTADTARFAFLAGNGTHVLIGAKNSSLGFVQGHHLNQRIGAGLNALLTGAAGKGVDSCNAVADVNCIIGAGLNSIAVSDTAVDTFLGSAEKLFCHFAGFNTLIHHFGVAVGFDTLAKHNSRHGLNCACFKSCNAGNLF